MLMRYDMIKMVLWLIAFMGSSASFARTMSEGMAGSPDSLSVDTVAGDTLLVNTIQDTVVTESCARDTAYYRSIMFYRDNSRYNLKAPYPKEIFKFKYDPFKTKMKEPWLGDILKAILFR